MDLGADERLERRTCPWCGAWVPYSGKGRPPVYCSKAHRNRAWEVRSAEARLHRDLAAGRATAGPVREIVSRPPDVRPARVPTRVADWRKHLDALAEQLAEGDFDRKPWTDHARILGGLRRAMYALDKAIPGGIDALDRRY